ncbi:MAG: GNAT family N-acetyltransferase [Massiliimalia sp.]|jgi:putative acetyltransferase
MKNFENLIIRPETHADYHQIIQLVLRSFREGTDYSDGTDVLALVEEIRNSPYYLPKLSFVAEWDHRIVGHFLFSRFPLSADPKGHQKLTSPSIAMLAPVSVHANYFRQGVGTAMLTQGIEQVRAAGFDGITVEGNYRFYNHLGFRTSSEYGIYPTSGYPMTEPKCMMCQETKPGSLQGVHGYVVYDMYYNA